MENQTLNVQASFDQAAWKDYGSVTHVTAAQLHGSLALMQDVDENEPFVVYTRHDDSKDAIMKHRVVLRPRHIEVTPLRGDEDESTMPGGSHTSFAMLRKFAGTVRHATRSGKVPEA